MYDLDELIRVFKENAEICKRENERALEQFKQDAPGASIPEWFTRDFCINTALASMCQEIDKLRIELGGWK